MWRAARWGTYLLVFGMGLWGCGGGGRTPLTDADLDGEADADADTDADGDVDGDGDADGDGDSDSDGDLDEDVDDLDGDLDGDLDDDFDGGPECEDDGLEENDEPETPTELGEGEFTDLRICPRDDDFYAIELGVGDEVFVDLAFSHASGNINMELVGPDGALVASSSSTDDGESLSHVADRAGTHLIMVILLDDDDVPGNDYDLSIVIEEGIATCEDDGFEDNDTFVRATGVTEGTFADLRSCPGDDDYYRMDLGVGDTVTAHVRFSNAEGNIDIELRDPEGELVAAGDGTGDVERVIHTAELAGSYVLRVTLLADAGAEGNGYELEIDIEEGVTTCEDDGYEDNDTILSAPPVREGDFPGLWVCPGDLDFFSIELGAGDELTVSLSFSNAEGNIDLRLKDEIGRGVAVSVGATDDEAITYTASEAGTYLIRVNLHSDGGTIPGNGYDMTIVHEPAPSLCDDDIYENNNSMGRATPIDAGTLRDLHACPGDPDLYRFNLREGDEIGVSLAFTHAEGNIDLRLADSAGSVVASSMSAEDRESLTYVATETGSHYIRVDLTADSGATPGNDYVMTVTHDPAAVPCTDDGFEENDTPGGAAGVEEGTQRGLRVCPGDLDYYAFDLDAGDELRVDLVFSHDEGNIDLRLMEDGTERILASSLSTSDRETITYTAPESGTFLIRVNLNGDSGRTPGNSYDMTIVHEPAVLLCEDDGLENNDSISRATPIEEGDFPGLQVCPGDLDFFSIDLNEGDELTVTLDFSHAEGDIDLRLKDPDGRALAFSLSDTDGESFTYTATADGTYYIRVDLHFDSGAILGNRYDMTVEHEPVVIVPCDDDAYEENDSMSRATSIDAGTYRDLQICPSDLDYYSFNLHEGDEIGVVLDFRHSEGNIDLRLIEDGSGRTLAYSITDDDDESIVYTAPSTGTYYIRVNLNGDSGTVEGNGYDMIVTHDPAPLPCDDDLLENNDTAGTATEVEEGVYRGLQACPDDPDYYSIDLGAGDELDVSLAFTHAEGNIDLRLIQASTGRTVASSTSTSDHERIDYTAAAAGTYYILVDLTTDSGETPGNGYNMAVAIEPFVPPTCEDDAYENNDSALTASPIDAGSFPDLQSCPDDLDFYSVDLGVTQEITVDLTFSHAEGNIDLRLVQESTGRTVASSLTRTNNESLSFTVSVADTYFIRVNLNGDSGGTPGNSYDMAVDIAGEDFGCPGHFEMTLLPTRDVCIDRFEASEGAGGQAVSRAGAIPWRQISQADAAAACAAAGKRLCTAAEWRTGCHGPDNTRYPYGEFYDAWFCNGADRREGAPTPTGSLTDCEGGYDGIFDMSGNLWEWVSGCGGGTCVAYGGSYYDIFGTNLDCDSTTDREPTTEVPNIGFRCCLTL